MAASLALIAPALPSSFSVPPAGRSAVSLNGKEESKEKLLTSMFTLSYTRGCSLEPARLTVRRPSLTASLATERFGLTLDDDCDETGSDFAAAGFAGVAAFCVGEADWEDFLLPRLEKFHFSPFCERTRLICGPSRVRSVTCSALEKISGINSTPTFKDFACTKGDWLKAGSSAMEMLSAVTPPESSESERFPTFTCRPSASVSSDSRRGRNRLASMKKGSAMAITIRMPITIPKILRKRFM